LKENEEEGGALTQEKIDAGNMGGTEFDKRTIFARVKGAEKRRSPYVKDRGEKRGEGRRLRGPDWKG